MLIEHFKDRSFQQVNVADHQPALSLRVFQQHGLRSMLAGREWLTAFSMPRFRLLNMRSDVRFAFIRNPKEWSVVAAVTDIIRFDNLNAPLQGHLALTGIAG